MKERMWSEWGTESECEMSMSKTHWDISLLFIWRDSPFSLSFILSLSLSFSLRARKREEAATRTCLSLSRPILVHSRHTLSHSLRTLSTLSQTLFFLCLAHLQFARLVDVPDFSSRPLRHIQTCRHQLTQRNALVRHFTLAKNQLKTLSLSISLSNSLSVSLSISLSISLYLLSFSLSLPHFDHSLAHLYHSLSNQLTSEPHKEIQKMRSRFLE